VWREIEMNMKEAARREDTEERRCWGRGKNGGQQPDATVLGNLTVADSGNDGQVDNEANERSHGAVDELLDHGDHDADGGHDPDGGDVEGSVLEPVHSEVGLASLRGNPSSRKGVTSVCGCLRHELCVAVLFVGILNLSFPPLPPSTKPSPLSFLWRRSTHFFPLLHPWLAPRLPPNPVPPPPTLSSQRRIKCQVHVCHAVPVLAAFGGGALSRWCQPCRWGPCEPRPESSWP
jgi:hypothetical protein